MLLKLERHILVSTASRWQRWEPKHVIHMQALHGACFPDWVLLCVSD